MLIYLKTLSQGMDELPSATGSAIFFLTKTLSTSDTVPRAPGIHSHGHGFRDAPSQEDRLISFLILLGTSGRLSLPIRPPKADAHLPVLSSQKRLRMRTCRSAQPPPAILSTQRGFLGNHPHHCPHPLLLRKPCH